MYGALNFENWAFYHPQKTKFNDPFHTIITSCLLLKEAVQFFKIPLSCLHGFPIIRNFWLGYPNCIQIWVEICNLLEILLLSLSSHDKLATTPSFFWINGGLNTHYFFLLLENICLFQLEAFAKWSHFHQMIALIENKAALKSKRQALKTLILKITCNSLRVFTLKQVIPSLAKCFILLISRMMSHILEAAPIEYTLKGDEKSLMGFPKSHRSITVWEVNEALSPFLNNTQFLLTLFKMSFLRHFKVSKHFRSLKRVTKLICSVEAFEDKNAQLASRFCRSMFTGRLSQLLKQKKKPYNHSYIKGISQVAEPVILKTIKGSASIKFRKTKVI